MKKAPGSTCSDNTRGVHESSQPYLFHMTTTQIDKHMFPERTSHFPAPHLLPSDVLSEEMIHPDGQNCILAGGVAQGVLLIPVSSSELGVEEQNDENVSGMSRGVL